MALDIIEVTVSVDGDTSYAVGDVLFDLTEVPLPSRACKIINAFFEAESILRMFGGVSEDTGGAGGGGSHPLILKGSEDTSFSHGVYVGGIQISQIMDYTADRTAKLILHVEY